MIEPRPQELARRCLPALDDVQVERLPGGGNNRLYRVRAAGEELVLKHYFRHPDRPQDRLAAEFAFLEYAWCLGLRCIPEPVRRDDRAGTALYRFLPGRPLTAAEVGLAEVRQALSFLEALNGLHGTGTGRCEARRLGPAAEACFSVEAHLRLLAGRVERLGAIPGNEPVDAQAARFVAGKLAPAFGVLAGRIRARLGAAPPPWALELPAADRVVSPSDFGFHNALRQPDGGIAFLDFEHAGWDDPAKLVCDLFFQPALPLPRAALAEVTDRVAGLVADGRGARERIALLWPAIGLKWCCILLNHFTAVDLARRSFAAGEAGAAAEAASARKQGQLANAERLLAELSIEGGG